MHEPLKPIVMPPGAEPGQLDAFRRIHEDYAAAYLVGIRNDKTRRTYRDGLKQWFAFCDRMGFDPMAALRPHVELWLRDLELKGRKPRTIACRFTPVKGFYDYLLDEDVTTKNPCRRIARPAIPRVSPTGYLRESQIFDIVLACKAFGPHELALASLLCFNGLRINEACSLNIGSVQRREHFPIIVVKRKGGDTQWVEVGLGTYEALKGAIADRPDGNGRSKVARTGADDEPLLLTRYGTRMNQKAAQRILDRATPHVRGGPPHIHPHVLRHSWTTATIRNGVTMDQVVRDGGWADARMATSIYSHAGELPGRGAAHRLEAQVLAG